MYKIYRSFLNAIPKVMYVVMVKIMIRKTFTFIVERRQQDESKTKNNSIKEGSGNGNKRINK